jgi:hypothetical protein
MSNNALGCSSRWVADCDSRVCDVVISRTKAASMLASIWVGTGEYAMAVMNMDVVLWKEGHLGVIRHLSWMVWCSSQYCYGTPQAVAECLTRRQHEEENKDLCVLCVQFQEWG